MAEYTSKYKLKKPAPEDFADIADLNGNMDIIDEALGKKADLDDAGKVQSSQLPDLNYIPLSQKGKAGGVASLDSAGRVPAAQIPSLSYVSVSQIGQPGGIAALDSEGKIPLDQLSTVGVPPQIIVTVASDSIVTCTDGTTVVTGVSENGKCVLDVPDYGIWSVYATLNGRITATEDLVVDQVKQYALKLSYFAATITVTAEPKATVTLTDGTHIYTGTCDSNGKCAQTVSYTGAYTASATLNNCKSSSVSVSATADGGSYAATVKFITLTVTVDSGSEVTAANGSTTLKGASTGTVKFYLPNTGTWSIAATLNEKSTDGSIVCSSYADYSLKLAFTKIYGAQWDGSAAATWSRTDDAADFTNPVPYVAGATAYSSPFDNLQPWAGMTRVTDDEAGELVSIPKYWYKWTKSGNTMKLQIADGPMDGFLVSPAHADRGDGKGERDIVYVGRYHCEGSEFKSLTEKTPNTSNNRSTYRTEIHKLGTTIWQYDFAMYWTIMMLYLVEFANWNVQETIGYGGGPRGDAKTGVTDSMPYHTGTMQSDRNTYGVGCQYRNIEGLWDGAFDWIDGIYFGDASRIGIYCIKNPANFSESGGTKVGTRLTKSGYISAWSIPTVSGFEYALYPSAVYGSESTYIGDNCEYGSSGTILRAGGDSTSQNYGLFSLYGGNTTSNYGQAGCRLQKLP